MCPASIEEFSRSLFEELDYLHEGKNAERFARNFAGQPDVVVPKVVWSHTTKRVLTLAGRGSDQDHRLRGHRRGRDRAAHEVATKLLDVYLKQVFEDGFFHADPHPGNLFVLPAPAGTAPAAGSSSSSISE